MASGVSRSDWMGQQCQQIYSQMDHTIFLETIFCFNSFNSLKVNCSVKNITTGFTWSNTLYNNRNGDVSGVLLPNSILSIRDGDDTEITADEDTK